jgi:hypothetical protein
MKMVKVPAGCYENWAYERYKSSYITSCESSYEVYFNQTGNCYSIYEVISQAMIQPMMFLGVAGMFFSIATFSLKKKMLSTPPPETSGSSASQEIPLLSVEDLTFLDFLCVGEILAVYSYVITAYSFANTYFQILLLLFALFVAPFGALLFFADLKGFQTFGEGLKEKVLAPWEALRSSGLLEEFTRFDQFWKFIMVFFLPVVIMLVMVTMIFFGLIYVIMSFMFGFIVCLGSPSMLGVVVLSSKTEPNRETFMKASLRSILSVYLIRTIPELILMCLNEAQTPSKFSTPAFVAALVFIGLITIFNIFVVVRVLKQSKFKVSVSDYFHKVNKSQTFGTSPQEHQQDFTATDPEIPFAVVESQNIADAGASSKTSLLRELEVKNATTLAASLDENTTLGSSTLQPGRRREISSDGDHDDLAEPDWMNHSVYRDTQQQYGNDVVQSSISSSTQNELNSASASSKIECTICLTSDSPKKALGCGHVLCENCVNRVELLSILQTKSGNGFGSLCLGCLPSSLNISLSILRRSLPVFRKLLLLHIFE